MVVYKNNRIVRNLYPLKVLKADFVQVQDCSVELGFGLVVNFNKEAKLLSGDFAKIVLLCRITRDDTGSDVFETSNFTDRFSVDNMKQISKSYIELLSQKDVLFKKFKEDFKVRYVKDIAEKKKIFADAGFSIMTKEEEMTKLRG